MDNVTFHSEKSIAKWKFVFHRRITLESEFYDDTKKFNEIVYLLIVAQILKTMMNICPFYPKLVKKFIVNLSKGFNDARSGAYKKVHVRGNYFSFSPTIINDYLRRGVLIITDYVPSLMWHLFMGL